MGVKISFSRKNEPLLASSPIKFPCFDVLGRNHVLVSSQLKIFDSDLLSAIQYEQASCNMEELTLFKSPPLKSSENFSAVHSAFCVDSVECHR